MVLAQNNSLVSLLSFDLLQQTEDILTKILILDNLRLYPVLPFLSSFEKNVEFIVVNETSNLAKVYKIGRFEFFGKLQLESISISGEIVNNTLMYNSSFNETRNLSLNVMILNEFNEGSLNLPIKMNFEFQETFLNFSEILFEKLGSLTNLYFNEQISEVKLQQYFSGHIINYFINKRNDDFDKFYLRTMIEFEKEHNLLNYLIGNIIIIDSLLYFDMLFILDLNMLRIFDASNNFKSVMSYPLPDHFDCFKLYKHEEKPIIFVSCDNNIEGILRLYTINYTDKLFPDSPIYYENKSLSQSVSIIDVKSSGKFLFIIKTILESLNESQIDIYVFEGYDLNLLDSINANSLGFDYLYVDLLQIQKFNDSDNFGLIFVQLSSLIYIELKISETYGLNVSIPITIPFLDILNNLKEYMIFQIDNNLTKIISLYWKKIDSHETFGIILGSNFHLIELSLNRQNFLDYNVSLLYLAYLQCENLLKFQIIDNFLINSCKFSNQQFSFFPDKYYLTLYNKNDNSSTENNYFNKTHVFQALSDDIDYTSRFFIYKEENKKKYKLLVLYPNLTIFNYILNESMFLVKSEQFVNSHDLIENYELEFLAFNDYSNISIKIEIKSEINPIDVTKFIIFIILPLLISLLCVIGTHFFITLTRKKRKEMILEQFSYCKEQKNKEFEVNWLGSHAILE